MTVLMPIVAAIAASLLLDEPITTTLLAGGVILLAGVYVGALSGRQDVRTPRNLAVLAPDSGGPRTYWSGRRYASKRIHAGPPIGQAMFPLVGRNHPAQGSIRDGTGATGGVAL
jgi:hypothetical protein